MKDSVLAIITNFAAHEKICSCISLLLLAVMPVAAKGTQPNILFIVVDNQPASILGAYGNPDVKTPNIDRLAKRSTARQSSQTACHASVRRATMSADAHFSNRDL